MIKNFKAYNESIRGAMKPKSEDEILQRIKNSDPQDMLYNSALYNYKEGIDRALEKGADINFDINYVLDNVISNSDTTFDTFKYIYEKTLPGVEKDELYDFKTELVKHCIINNKIDEFSFMLEQFKNKDTQFWVHSVANKLISERYYLNSQMKEKILRALPDSTLDMTVVYMNKYPYEYDEEIDIVKKIRNEKTTQSYNESLRDQMKPKDDSDIVSGLEKIEDPIYRMNKGFDYGFGDKFKPTDKELKKKIGRKLFNYYKSIEPRIKEVEEMTPLKFAGYDIDKHFHWKDYISLSFIYDELGHDVLYDLTYYLKDKTIKIQVLRGRDNQGDYTGSKEWGPIKRFILSNVAYDVNYYKKLSKYSENVYNHLYDIRENNNTYGRVLTLQMSGDWFKMIASGEKKEEYRLIKPFWDSRLDGREYDTVRFIQGRRKDSPNMWVECKGIQKGGQGRPEWGWDRECYIIKLGEVLNVENNGIISEQLKLTPEIQEYLKGYESDEQLLRNGGIPIELLDMAAFGFNTDTITTLMPDQLRIEWKDDLDNVKREIKQKGLTDIEYAKSVDLSEPIDVEYKKVRGVSWFFIQDGHHRYYAAKILNKPLNVNLEIKINPFKKIGGDLSYDEFHREAWKQVKNKR